MSTAWSRFCLRVLNHIRPHSWPQILDSRKDRRFCFFTPNVTYLTFLALARLPSQESAARPRSDRHRSPSLVN